MTEISRISPWTPGKKKKLNLRLSILLKNNMILFKKKNLTKEINNTVLYLFLRHIIFKTNNL